MISRVLIANRGEIALRIIRACSELGIESVAAHSKVDGDQHYLDYADDAVCISQSSYLEIPSMVSAAKSMGCDAVHPGYGLLSENAAFADSLDQAGITFIGPSVETIRVMANKSRAIGVVQELGLQAIPGSDGPLKNVDDALVVAEEIGFPVLIKAVFGGGGRGMRVARTPAELDSGFHSASREAAASFGEGALYIEKYLPSARHIEVQIAGDGSGNAIHLGTRDCSIQRNHQKVVEEAPVQGIDRREIDDLSEQCAKAARKLNYRSVGTFEFLYASGQFYFIEMNTRLQVEHPVTEVVTGIDLVKLQLEIAMTGQLSISQRELQEVGHAIECRVNAESIDTGSGMVLPSPGFVKEFVSPGGPGIRLDSHLSNNQYVSHYYDSLVGKLVGFGRDRDEAIARVERGLKEMHVIGIETNLPLLRTIVASDAFRAGSVSTSFIGEVLEHGS